jgi:hypothetical protein
LNKGYDNFIFGFGIGILIGTTFGMLMAYSILNDELLKSKKTLIEMEIQLNRVEQYYEQATPVFTLLETVDSLVQSQTNFADLPTLQTPSLKSMMNFGVGGQYPDSSTIER